MICLGYFSSASRPISQSELASIIAQSERNNSGHGVTGLLCHFEGSFLQFLEGEESAVLETYERIVRDSRHIGLIEICRRPINERAFGSWSMGMVRPQASGNAEDAFVSELRNIQIPADAPHHHAIAPFLETFRAWIR